MVVDKSEDVEIGQSAQHDFRSPSKRWEPGIDLLDLFAEISMGQDNPLGDAGGSAGILVYGNIIEGEFYFRRIGLVLGNAVHPAIDVRGVRNISEGEFLQLLPEKSFNRIQKVANAHVDDLLDLRLRPQSDHALTESINCNENFGIRNP